VIVRGDRMPQCRSTRADTLRDRLGFGKIRHSGGSLPGQRSDDLGCIWGYPPPLRSPLCLEVVVASRGAT
jgi:hypothetical protein